MDNFLKKWDFNGDFNGEQVSAKIGYLRVFLSTHKSKKVDQKMGYQPQKVKKKRNSKNGVKTAQRPLFKEL